MVALLESGCSAVTPNLQFQRSVNSRLRRLLPPAELGRYAALTARHFSLTRMLAAFPVGIVNISGL
jgi:hypothetical protein